MTAFIWFIGSLIAIGILTADESDNRGIGFQIMLCMLFWPIVVGNAIGVIALRSKK